MRVDFIYIKCGLKSCLYSLALSFPLFQQKIAKRNDMKNMAKNIYRSRNRNMKNREIS